MHTAARLTPGPGAGARWRQPKGLCVPIQTHRTLWELRGKEEAASSQGGTSLASGVRHIRLPLLPFLTLAMMLSFQEPQSSHDHDHDDSGGNYEHLFRAHHFFTLLA